ncbi:hypothetical protein CC1G_02441 [Coprinopsis cinerea okayama7|uniref:Uncharacterized protein n=1 Tax=Coprinopsis cinerea (strain Okayama-7 / 130 / ATCC MYA-4618 / FGSC 9003) TaxID=240176 RepID=A8NBI1_COPC7|nr:hypothetical protein CC1G_02441 [Coprinopsis cinerea okayama7\|eukprot:XP_001832179.1 hypothetical protein CC1G_02441 [Coprinopsis cinerea okayama7\
MVQAATLVLAAFAVAPVLSAPLSQPTAEEESFTRSTDIDSDALELRDPKFNFGNFIKKAVGVAKTVGKVAIPAARLFLRDTDGNLYEIRALDDVTLDPDLPARDILESDDALLEREFADLDTRDPRFNLGRFLKKAKGVVGKVGGVAGKVAGVAASLALRDELDGLDLDARAYQELEELLEREFADIDELEVRDPRLRLGKLVKKVGRVAGKVGGVAGRVAGIAGGLGLRDLEGMETEIREVSLNDLD